VRCEHCGSIVLQGKQGYSPAEACELLGVSLSQLYRKLIHTGKVDTYKVGWLRFVTAESLERIVSDNRPYAETTKEGLTT